MVINGKHYESIPSYWTMLEKSNPLTYKIKYPCILGGDVILDKDPFLGHDIKRSDTRWKVPIWKWRETTKVANCPGHLTRWLST